MRAFSVVIDVLRSSEVARLRELNHLFAQAFDDPETYLAAPPEDEYLRDLLDKPHVVAIVATADGALIGGLVAYQLEKLERRRSEFYIYDLAVSALWRRRGVATALIARLREIAAARGAWVIFVQADHGDDAAIALYQKLGAREDVLHFDIPPRASDEP